MPPIATAAATVLLGFALVAGHAARAAEGVPEPIDRSWPHQGLFGTYDRAAMQRGLQVYREVCSGCHSLDYVAFRNLDALGFNEDELRSLAGEYSVADGPDDSGEMYERPGQLTDRFPAPYPNDGAARAANGGALPPDLSLITKARADGTDYLYSLLLGYQDPPAGEEGPEGMYYNLYFPGHWIGMPPPLTDGAVQYADGTEASVEQMSADLATFLTWAAEPTLEARKQSGLKVMLFLIVLTALLYATKRKVWAELYRRPA